MDEVRIYQEPGEIRCDFESVKSQLEVYLKQYDGVIFTEDTKNDAKKTVAELRKAQKTFIDRVKMAKAEYMKTWDAFLPQANELIDMFDKPIMFINDQVQAFEEQRKKDKLDTCNTIYADMVPEEDMRAYLPFNRVYNEKWLNTTYTEKQIKEDIMTAKMNVKTGLETITAFNSDVTDTALKVFKETLDMAEALKVITKYEESKKIALAAEKTRIVQEAKEQARAEVQEEVIENLTPVDDGSEVVAYAYSIFLNSDAKAKLEAYMDSVGIEYFCRRERA